MTGLVFEDGSDNLSIGNQAFQNCKSVVGNIVFPLRLTSIGDKGFDKCLSVSAFQFPQAKPIPYNNQMLQAEKNVIVPSLDAVANYENTWNIGARHAITAENE